MTLEIWKERYYGGTKVPKLELSFYEITTKGKKKLILRGTLGGEYPEFCFPVDDTMCVQMGINEVFEIFGAPKNTCILHLNDEDDGMRLLYRMALKYDKIRYMGEKTLTFDETAERYII